MLLERKAFWSKTADVDVGHVMEHVCRRYGVSVRRYDASLGALYCSSTPVVVFPMQDSGSASLVRRNELQP